MRSSQIFDHLVDGLSKVDETREKLVASISTTFSDIHPVSRCQLGTSGDIQGQTRPGDIEQFPGDR